MKTFINHLTQKLIKSRTRHYAVFLLPLFLFTGCLEFEYRIKINSDGSEKVTIKITAPQTMSTGYGDFAKEMEQSGYTVTTETQGDKFCLIGTQTYTNKDWRFPYPKELTKGDIDFKHSFKDYFLFKSYSVNTDFELDSELVSRSLKELRDNPYLSDVQIPFKYIIEAPGTIDNQNAREVTGNKMEWLYNIRMGEHVQVSFNSHEINYPYSAIALTTMLGLIFGIVIMRKISRAKIMSENQTNQISV